MNCNCNCRNGQDNPDFLITSPTAGVYVLGLTHYTCGNRKMALSDPARPVIANLGVAAVGAGNVTVAARKGVHQFRSDQPPVPAGAAAAF